MVCTGRARSATGVGHSPRSKSARRYYPATCNLLVLTRLGPARPCTALRGPACHASPVCNGTVEFGHSLLFAGGQAAATVNFRSTRQAGRAAVANLNRSSRKNLPGVRQRPAAQVRSHAFLLKVLSKRLRTLLRTGMDKVSDPEKRAEPRNFIQKTSFRGHLRPHSK